MSSRHEERSDDLTTDALPSPPRDESENSRKYSSDDDNKESQFEEINTSGSRARSRKPKIRGFTNVKRISPPTGYGSIININNSNGIRVGDEITYNFTKAEKPEKLDVVETKAIRILRECTDPVTVDDLLFIASHIDERWRDIGRALNYSDGQIEQFFIDNINYGIKEVIYKLLLDWFRNEPTKKTLACLSNILWDQNQRDVVKRWSEKDRSSNN